MLDRSVSFSYLHENSSTACPYLHSLLAYIPPVPPLQHCNRLQRRRYFHSEGCDLLALVCYQDIGSTLESISKEQPQKFDYYIPQGHILEE